MNFRCLLIVVLFSLFSSCSLFAQLTDSLTTEPTHSVKRAAILSAIIPGGGQIYNHIASPKRQKKGFWKVPLIYAGLGATTYLLISNQQRVNLYKNEYLQREAVNFQPGVYYHPETASYDAQALLTLHSGYQTNRDLMILAVTGVYLINILDAVVNAHFVNFDISDDLTMRVQPRLLYAYTPGISFQFNFH
jgi:hypothetical protein